MLSKGEKNRYPKYKWLVVLLLVAPLLVATLGSAPTAVAPGVCGGVPFCAHPANNYAMIKMRGVILVKSLANLP